MACVTYLEITPAITIKDIALRIIKNQFKWLHITEMEVGVIPFTFKMAPLTYKSATFDILTWLLLSLSLSVSLIWCNSSKVLWAFSNPIGGIEEVDNFFSAPPPPDWDLSEGVGVPAALLSVPLAELLFVSSPVAVVPGPFDTLFFLLASEGLSRPPGTL